MEGSISSDNGRDDPDFGIFCFCGEPAPLTKSTTQNNPGRRFFGCTNYQTRRDCGFFCWYEPSISQNRSHLGPMRVQTKTNAFRTVEQCESSKKRKTTTIMDPSVWRNLPPEIIHRVLSLLPVKCLCRFKCVSPSWNSLISSPHFAKTHLHITNNTPNKPQKTLLISSSHALYSVDFAAANPTMEKLDFALAVGALATAWFWFPMKECKELPDSHALDLCCLDNIHFIVNGVGYDSSSDDYKVVMLHSREIVDYNGISNITCVAVYSLKANAWRRIQDSRYNPMEHLHGVCFNERLHWLCRRTDGYKVVVAFDLGDEIFREVHLPTSFTSSDIYRLGFDFKLVAGSCLCLVVPSFRGDRIDVWMMMRYEVRESWIKFTIAHGMSLEDVLYLAAEEEFVLRMIEEAIQPGREKLVVYNPKNGTLRDKVVCGIPTKYTVGGNYIETLISPNHGGSYEASLGESSKSYQLIAEEHPSSNPAN